MVAQPSFCAEIGALLTENRLTAWRAWARWRLVSALAPYLSHDFVEENFRFYGTVLSGTPELKERWKRGVAVVEGALGEAVGQLYVERHFSPAAKQRMDDLVGNLIEAYRRSITELDWMTEETKAEALSKLAKFRPHIGYPSKWRDYGALEVRADDLVGNVMRAASFELDRSLTKIGQPVDREEWLMTPQTVNAYYHPLKNEIVFPAAILQPPFFNEYADDAVNYGGIGSVIGHEIGHGFDDQGSTCDGDGALRDWWSEADRTAFELRTKALIGQYNVLEPSETPGHYVNGELTIGENIGDLGGLSIALKAYRIARGDDRREPIEGYTDDQRLFLAWAALWQAKSRPELVRQRLATDPHSPPSSAATRSSATSPSSTSPSTSRPKIGSGWTPTSASRSGSPVSAIGAEDVHNETIRTQFEAFLDEHRSALNHSLDGLTEEEARRSLVPSRTTLLGLVKHATFVEKVWFDQAMTRRSRAEIGIPETPDESFVLDDEDTIATVQAAHLEACESSRRATSTLGLDDVLPGNRRGPLPLRWVYLHVLRELAQHCGHADILREQILNKT